MSYLSPVIIEQHVHSTFWMGVILSSSSAAGLLTDVLVPKLFPTAGWRFFVKWLLLIAVFFPLSFIWLPAHNLTFLIAMIIWGVYYELISFGEFNFVHETVDVSSHASAWGVIDTFKSLAGIIAPILAAYLIVHGAHYPLWLSVGSIGVALAILPFLQRHPSHTDRVTSPSIRSRLPSFLHELHIWWILVIRIWPVYIFFFALILLETAFWTVGPLLSEEMKQIHPFGGIMLSAYILPFLITPLMIGYLGQKFGKKHTAFVSAIIGSCLLSASLLVFHGVLTYIVIIFVSMIFISIDYPEIDAVFEDYLARIGNNGNDLIGLRSTASSFAYIIGPIMAGGLSEVVGNRSTIGIFALMLLVVAVISLVVTPRKILMPHAALTTENQ